MPLTLSHSPMPVDAILPTLAAALNTHSRAILVAPPGSGKTTRVPLFLADVLQGKVLVLEPRRLAARSASRHMARMLGEDVGQQVGYRVRLESKVSRSTRVELITEGILTRRLLSDPELQDVSCVIFDEFHERSLQADLGLALCLEVQQALRPDLKVVVMSATLDVEALAEFLAPCPVLQAEGRVWPVEIRYAPPVPQAGQRQSSLMVADAVSLAVRRALTEEAGSVLAFLPGTGEIRRTADLLQGNLPAGTQLYPLYGDLPAAEQDAAIAPCPAGQRKVVLSTALAETSLTIEGVRVVIDGGLARTARHDTATDMNRLITERVTQAGADQRAGRAGRVEPGVCYRLWNKGDVLLPHPRPEILEADLAPLVLECLVWGAQPEAMPWLAPPPESALARARQTLILLGAITKDSRLTPHGEALARLPLHPRLGHMVLMAGERSALAACLAAIISERDPLPGTADIRTRLGCFRQNQRLKRMAEQIYSLSPAKGSFRLPAHEDEDFSGTLLSLAWPDRIAQRREPGSFRMASGKGAFLPDTDPLAKAPFLAIASLQTSLAPNSGDSRIFLAAPLTLTDIEQAHGSRIRAENTVYWDKREQALAAVARVCLDALILEERPLPLTGDLSDVARSAVLEGIRALGLSTLPWTDDLRQWQARVALLRSLEPDWPDVSDAALLESLELWLAPFLSGITRRTHFSRIPLADALHALTPWPLDQRLNAEAPTRITVPTGNAIRIDYTAEGGPVLAVKLQEMFGQTTTPTIAAGRLPLTLHLLSPAGRPLQITRDLQHFWQVSYFAVRADMRGRYPKHPWPDNPLAAMPTARVKRKSGALPHTPQGE